MSPTAGGSGWSEVVVEDERGLGEPAAPAGPSGPGPFALQERAAGEADLGVDLN
jgi:hypothetical protein